MRQLHISGEMFHTMDKRSLILIWTEDSYIFRAEIPNGSLLQSEESLSKAVGQHIPQNHLFPHWCDTFTEAQQPLSTDVYVKKHYGALLGYDGTPYASELVMAEIEVLEIISKKDHPNVIKYLGCIRDGDAVAGICLQNHVCTLSDLVKGRIPANQAPPFQPDVIISGIKAALEHIHSFGLVHDDINPRNIMVDIAGNPIVIDFDSCVAVGAPSRGGTPGWSKSPKVAAFENDNYGSELVAKFVQGEYDGQDYFDFDFDEAVPPEQ
ncbi:kinase-like domain-containing protein [Crassisporium funariophilum]|nr:kinase-like domain-containing protein [Crassisporium funariophilum]